MDVVGFLVLPVPEVGNLRLLELIDRFAVAFDRSGGKRLIWRPIGDPRKTGPVYERMRSDEIRERDALAIAEYDRYVTDRGSAEHHRLREIEELAQELHVTDIDRPCLVFFASHDFVDHPMLRIPRSLLASSEAQDALASELNTRLVESAVVDVLESDIITVRSVLQFQDYLQGVEDSLIAMEVLHEHGIPQQTPTRARFSYLLFGSLSNHPLSAERRDEIISGRNNFDLLMDEATKIAWLRTKKGNAAIKFTELESCLLAEVVSSDIAIAPGSFGEKYGCSSRGSSLKHFRNAKLKLERPMGTQLFEGERGRENDLRKFRFAPPPAMRWGVIRPMERCKP